MKNLFIFLIAVISIAFMSRANLKPTPPNTDLVEFCTSGTLGVCAPKVPGPGFACVSTQGTPDCNSTYWKNVPEE